MINSIYLSNGKLISIVKTIKGINLYGHNIEFFPINILDSRTRSLIMVYIAQGLNLIEATICANIAFNFPEELDNEDEQLFDIICFLIIETIRGHEYLPF